MRRTLSILLISTISIFLVCCNSNTKTEGSTYTEDGFAAFNADTLRHDITVLAADSLMGRKPFTQGETKAISYLQKRFAEVGLEPGNGHSYLQDVPMVNIETRADSVMQVQSP